MRSVKHWTIEYIINRALEIHYHRKDPTHPWLTKTANSILETYLKNTDVGLEIGAGRSTVWLARRIQHLTSVEHNPHYYKSVLNSINKCGIKNVELNLIDFESNNKIKKCDHYISYFKHIQNRSLDFALVDGICRDSCVLAVLEKIRPGGLVIIDNVNRYLPSDSRSPDSRTFQDGPDGAGWQSVAEAISDWRVIWTSSGVTDTALYFRPCEC